MTEKWRRIFRPSEDSSLADRLHNEMRSGADRDRTGDPLVANQVLSQLSYSPPSTMGAARGSHLIHDGGRQRQPSHPRWGPLDAALTLSMGAARGSHHSDRGRQRQRSSGGSFSLESGGPKWI